MGIISNWGICTSFFFACCIPNTINSRCILNTSCLDICSWASSIGYTSSSWFSNTSCDKSSASRISSHCCWSICTRFINTCSSIPIAITTCAILNTSSLDSCSSTSSSGYTSSISFCCACTICSKGFASFISC